MNSGYCDVGSNEFSPWLIVETHGVHGGQEENHPRAHVMDVHVTPTRHYIYVFLALCFSAPRFRFAPISTGGASNFSRPKAGCSSWLSRVSSAFGDFVAPARYPQAVQVA